MKKSDPGTLSEQPSTSKAVAGHKRGTKPGTKIHSVKATLPKQNKYSSLEKRNVGKGHELFTIHRTRVVNENVDKTGDVAEVKLVRDDERLIHVEYPGIVENPANAVRTLGGIVKISEVLHNPSKKLELRFRPENVFCNPVYGFGRTTTGLLIRIRRRKVRTSTAPKEDQPRPNLINLDEIEKNDELLEEAKNRLMTDGEGHLKKIIKQEAELVTLIKDEEEFQTEFDGKDLLKNTRHTIGGVKTVIRLPHPNYRPKTSQLQVEPLGVVNKTYDSFGVCDFQYLPTITREDGEHVSIADNIFPGFGDPERDVLYDYEGSGMPEEKKYFPFFVPPVMSRLDKTIININKTYVANPTESNSEMVLQTGVLENLRARRSVYTNLICFPWSDDPVVENQFQVPNKPFDEAVHDVMKRFCGSKLLEVIQRKFDERPMWTKLALYWETKISFDNLKYLLPCTSYFCINGPWRGLWTRFGYDPRKETNAFQYQLIDYRVPADYRHFVDIDEEDNERVYKFKPDIIPPKSQMFYQLCDINVPEIHELMGVLTVRLNTEAPPCNPKYGYLDEDVVEFCRYCMSHCLETRLHELGKISHINLPGLRLEPGGTIPSVKLWEVPRRIKKKFKKISAATGKPRKSIQHPEQPDMSVEYSQDSTPGTHLSLTDYFDDDEEMEEEDTEPFEPSAPSTSRAGGLESFFLDDEHEDSNDSGEGGTSLGYIEKNLAPEDF